MQSLLSNTTNEQNFQGYVYALGNLYPVFPSNSVKNEFYRVANLTAQNTLTTEIFYTTLNQNNYLAKAMCWVWKIGSIESYIVIPKYASTLKKFVDSLNPPSNQSYLESLTGDLGPAAPPALCFGKQLPIVWCYHFDISNTLTDFITLIVNQTGLQQNVAQSVLSNLLRLADNLGNTDKHRALNFLTLTYFELYKFLGDKLQPSSPDDEIFLYGGVRSDPVPDKGNRTVLNIIFDYQDPTTAIHESCYVQVDVTERFPFVVGTLAEGTPDSV